MQNVQIDKKITEKVLSYIKESWEKSIRSANDTVPYPYTSPSITGMFSGFFYWDNYLIHKGLLLDGLDKQVKYNLDNFKYYVERFGYVPNGSTMLTRSQPPVFTRCVYEYYLFKQDKAILQEYLPVLVREYNFWMTERVLPCGLNSYGCTATDEQLKRIYRGLSARVDEYRETEEEQIALAKDILALAESGLDFNMRFVTSESKIDASKFIHLDINCFLYDVEITLAKMFAIVGDTAKESEFNAYAEKRKQLINQYLFDKTQGIYLDYNFVDGSFSKIVSGVSFMPYAYGISNDSVGAKKILETLELPFGVPACPSRGEDAFYYQWDYPCIWPYVVWFAYNALKNVGLNSEAERVAKKYMLVINDNFEKTGILWEKYDARDGSVAKSNEYKTPEMLGWTAGLYREFAEALTF